MRNYFKYFIISVTLLLTNELTNAQKPILVEFGWDYPNVNTLKTQLSKMQSTPFDGICFSIKQQIIECFDTTTLSESEFQYEDLKKLAWGKYTNNYIYTRGYSQTGGHWFDDKAWGKIILNTYKLSKALLYSKAKGILFDPEYYPENQNFNPWTYSKKQYPDKTLKQVQDQVRKRGIQYIKALQKHTLNLKFLSLWVAELIVEEMKTMPFQNTRQVLLLSFIEGVLEGKNKGVTIADGNELAYWYNKPSQFLNSKEVNKKDAITLMQSSKAKALFEKIEISQPVFYDGLLGLAPQFDKGLNQESKWKWLEENIKYAITSSDKMVWFYSERINWWQNNSNDTLVNILKNIKSALSDTSKKEKKGKNKDNIYFQTGNNINSGLGHNYSLDRTFTYTPAFEYSLDRSNQILKINFKNKKPGTISIFTNNSLTLRTAFYTSPIKLKLKSFKKGTIVMNVTFNDNTEATAIGLY